MESAAFSFVFHHSKFLASDLQARLKAFAGAGLRTVGEMAFPD